MKKKILLLSLMALASCKECIECSKVNTDGANAGTTTVDEWCDGETMSGLNQYYQGLENQGLIESGWKCN